jgi:hypothetical protein
MEDRVTDWNWSEERKQQWRIEKKLEEIIRLLELIAVELVPSKTFKPTTTIAVIPVPPLKALKK